jgi:segregation and condensation protein B
MAFPESNPEETPDEISGPPEKEPAELQPEEFLSAEMAAEVPAPGITMEDAKLKAVLEAIIYVTDEPLSLEQICAAIEQPRERVIELLEQLAADYERPERGLSIREIAGGFMLTTKPEHHEEVRRFVKNLNPPLKLSLPALETLAVIAYKQPITAPEIMEIRGVQGAGVLKTLLDRKLIGTAGRKQVIGKPILYKTTREFLVQFGLKDLNELPSLKEFQEIGRLATETPNAQAAPPDPKEPIEIPRKDPPPADVPEGDPPPADLPLGEPPPDEDNPAGNEQVE